VRLFCCVFELFLCFFVVILVVGQTLTATLGWDGIFKVLAALSLVAAGLVVNLQPLKQLPSSQV